VGDASNKKVASGMVFFMAVKWQKSSDDLALASSFYMNNNMFRIVLNKNYNNDF
jgi:hypothetical protein